MRGCGAGLGRNFSGDKRGRLEVDAYLRLKQARDIFVIGDSNSCLNELTGVPLPQLAQVAISQGHYAAKSIKEMASNKIPERYKHSQYGFIVPVSGKFAIFCGASGRIILSGFLGWVMRRLADLRYLLSVLPSAEALKIWMKENILYIRND